MNFIFRELICQSLKDPAELLLNTGLQNPQVWERFTKLDYNRLKQSRASYQSSAVRRLEAPRIFAGAEVLELLSWLCSSNVWSPKCLSLRCGFPIARLFPDSETLNCNLPKPLTICESSFNIFWKKGETGDTWKE